MPVVRYAWWSDQEHESIQLEKWGTLRLVHGVMLRAWAGAKMGRGFEI